MEKHREEEREKPTAHSTGKGGSGNIRKVQNSAIETAQLASLNLEEEAVLAAHAPTAVYSTGRGGSGNMGRTRNTASPAAVGGEETDGRRGRDWIGGIVNSLRAKSRDRSQSRDRSVVRGLPPSVPTEEPILEN